MTHVIPALERLRMNDYSKVRASLDNIEFETRQGYIDFLKQNKNPKTKSQPKTKMKVTHNPLH